MKKTFSEYLNQEKEKCENADIYTRLQYLYYVREQNINGKPIKYNEKLFYRYKWGNSFIYFQTEYELVDYLKKHSQGLKNIAIIDYIGEFENKDDVIRIIDLTSTRLVIDKNINEHLEYNFPRSKYEQLPVWVTVEGNIHDLILEFKKIGQEFKQDTIDQENLRLLKLVRLGLIK